jgi:radical SAM protein with 4Fe4S-binding SPASM domain
MGTRSWRRHSKYEAILSNSLIRSLFRLLTRRNGVGGCTLESVFNTYAVEGVPLARRARYFLPHLLIDRFARWTGTSRRTVRTRVFEHNPTARTLINTAASIAKHGLCRPQRFAAPILVVWNITQACNLKCKHCYQDASRKMAGELNQDEQLHIIDQLADNYVSLLAFAGGEPLISKEFWKTCRYAAERKLHVTVATNGTLLTEENVGKLRETGVKIIEISLDSINREKHDAFRGKGMWEKTVQGIRNSVAQSDGRNFRVSIASTITRMNRNEVQDLIRFTDDIGAHTFNAFNFIPTGRGRDIAAEDLSPEEREELLGTLHRNMQGGKVNILTTAPQLGRFCLEHRTCDWDAIAIGHGGSARGRDTFIYTEYLGGCGAGRCYCAIQPDGKVTPCVFMPIVVGNLRNQSFMEIWENTPEFAALSNREDRGDSCRVCRHRYQCGGCRARAFNYTGDFRAGDPGCRYNQRQWEQLLGFKERKAV